MSNKTTIALVGGVISTLYIMTIFVNQSYWLYHWALRIGGLSGFFLLGLLGTTKTETKFPFFATLLIGMYYGMMFASEFLSSYVFFIHYEPVENFKYFLLSLPLACSLLFSWLAALWLGFYYTNKWRLFNE